MSGVWVLVRVRTRPVRAELHVSYGARVHRLAGLVARRPGYGHRAVRAGATVTRFLFGPRGKLCEESSPDPRDPCRPAPAYAPDDPSKSDQELYEALVRSLDGGGPATQEERAGVFYRVRRVGDDGSFDFDEHHFMQACRCHVINNSIVEWCPAHAAYYRRVLTPEQFLIGADLARHWKGVETK